MSKVIGFIGCGNMSKAMVGGIVKSGVIKPENIIVSDLKQDYLDIVNKEFNVNTTTDSKEVVKNSDIIVVAVKPNVYDVVLKSVKDLITTDKIIVTIAAGKTIKSIEDVIGCDKKIVRTMPNTPALVNEGMSGLCKNNNTTDEELECIKTIFNSFGKAEIVSEYLIDSVIGVSGTAPAYVFMFIEAMADAAVLHGMARDKAYVFAAQAVMGSAKMVLETKKHPGELKDMVCSPGGTTIEAVKTLEVEGFRAAIMKAIDDCVEKSKSMI